MISTPTAARPGLRRGTPSDLRTTWLIARRAALESLRDITTVGFSAVSALVIPLLVAVFALRPPVGPPGVEPDALGRLVATFLLLIGLVPAGSSIGIAAGLFAGEKEQGTLLPLLATPASNRAIFAGKVLGAVLPAVLYVGIAEVSFTIEVGLLLGAGVLRLLPLAFSATMLALVPAAAVLGAAVASLVSSRVRTFQSAQVLSGLAIYPVMGALYGMTGRMQHWGPLALLGAVLLVFALDALIVLVSASTWRREEVLAQR